MSRPTTNRSFRSGLTALTVVALTALGACGGGDKEEDMSGACKDAVYKRYDAAIAAIDSSNKDKSSEDVITDFEKAVGAALPAECETVAPVFAQGIAEQVSLEYSDKIAVAIAKLKGLPDEDASAEPDSSADPDPSAEESESAEPEE